MQDPGQIRLSSGAVVVRDVNGQWRFLLLRAFNHWDFPKGMLEEGESPFDAALREIAEETTLDDLDFAWGHEFIETGPYSRGKTARYYLGMTRCVSVSLPVNPELGRPEHSEFRWVGVEEAFRLTRPRVRAVVRWAAERLGVDGRLPKPVP